MKFPMIIDTKRRAEGKLEKGDNENEKKQTRKQQTRGKNLLIYTYKL